MFCKTCGAPIADDAQFCEKCGTQSNAIAQETDAPIPVEHKEAPAVRKRSKAGLFVILGAAVVLIGAILAMLLLMGGGDANRFYHEMNFNNGGKVAFDDERVYFVGNYNEDDEEPCLFSTDHNGLNKKMILQNSDILDIRIVDGRIYYQISGEKEYTIHRILPDGSDDKTIVTSEKRFDKYDVSGDMLYYLNDSKISVCSLAGENTRVCVENAETFVIDGSVLFYAYNGLIYKFDLKTETATELCVAEEAARMMAVDNDTLYFVGSSGLCTVAVNGDPTVTKRIRDDRLGPYIVFGDRIYYNHTKTTEEIAEIAWDAAEGNKEKAIYYGLVMLGAGEIYVADETDSTGEAIDSSTTLIYSLYTTGDKLYRKITHMDNNLSLIEIPN